MCVRGWYITFLDIFMAICDPNEHSQYLFIDDTNPFNIPSSHIIILERVVWVFRRFKHTGHSFFNFELFLYISWAPFFFSLHPPNDQYFVVVDLDLLSATHLQSFFSPLRGVVILLFNQSTFF
jgi:hypothetical protein